jgi:hypothetical protein
VRMGEKRNAYKILVRKLSGRRPLGRSGHKCVNNIKTDLVEIDFGVSRLDWSGSGEGQLESSCECCNGPTVSIEVREYLEFLHNWWRLEYRS